MFFDESSYMNLYHASYCEEEESSNIFNPLNDNFSLDAQHYDDINYPHLMNENSKIINEADEKRENFLINEDSFNLFNPFDNLKENDLQFEKDFIEEQDLYVKNDNIKKEKVSDSGIKKTFNTSKENGQSNSIQMISKSSSKKPSKRIDYALKYFKTYFSNFLKEYSNKIIEKSELPGQFKKKRIFSPNHISYTGNPKESDDFHFLSFSVQEILTYYKDENCKISLQKKNKKTIEEILKFIDECEDGSKYEEVRDFFKMSLEDAYYLYYQNEAFKKYAKDEKAKYLDQEFKAQNGFSLLENNGFIKVVKMHGKKK